MRREASNERPAVDAWTALQSAMLRALRVEYPGAVYHIMDRGDRQERIFLDDVDRQDWLKTLASPRLLLDE